MSVIPYDKSFASHEKSRFWNTTLNKNIIPRNITKGTHIKFWFNCYQCNHNYECSIKNIVHGRGCPYCNSSKLCNKINCDLCFNKSFASHEKARYWHTTLNKNIIPRNITKHTHQKYWFKCDKCIHDICISICHVSTGKWCHYCSIPTKKICRDNSCNHCFERSFASHEKAIFWNTTLNKNIVPRNICKTSNTKYWFTCNICNNNFNSTLSHIVCSNRWCPFCKNKTEKKLFEFLNNNYNNIRRNINYSWCKNPDTNYYLPFDFEVNETIIIELDGIQHFQEVKYFRENLDTIQYRDMYKMEQAINNGKHVIRILQKDIWNDKNNWQEELKKNIDLLENDNDTKIICIGDCDIYNEYTII